LWRHHRAAKLPARRNNLLRNRVNGTKNLIMGLWTRHPFPPLEKFFASLRRTTFDGDVCIFVDDVSTETVASLQAQGVIVERTGRYGQPRMTALSSRFFNYLEFLIRRGGDYANVMLTDLRDVVFQSDPFATPLPAEIVYAQERCRLGDSPVNHNWVVQGYGEAVAHGMRDCIVSCAGTTFGTTSGMLRYLLAMTHELSSRTVPITGGIDQGVHNYVVRMHPLLNAWFDPIDQIVATMHFMPQESIQCTERGVLIDGRLVPVLHQWDRNESTIEYINAAPQFQSDGLTSARPRPEPRALPTQAPVTQSPVSNDAIIAYYQRERDADWLPLFLESLRCIDFGGSVHCVGVFQQHDLDLLSRYGAIAHEVTASESVAADNVAHFCMVQVLDQMAAEHPATLDQVMTIDSTRAVFLRDPFLSKTIGLSAFCEGAMRIGESEYNMHRLQFFVSPDEGWLHHPIISSTLLRGSAEVLREFYRKLFIEFVGQAQLISIPKVIQGAINKLCYGGGLGFPVIVHPNAAEVYFDFWPSDLAVDTRHGIRIGGSVPGLVMGESLNTGLLQTIRINLGLRTS
jgi:hypothetical protein